MVTADVSGRSLIQFASGSNLAYASDKNGNLRFDGVLYRPVATTPAKPVQQLFVFRKDNDNPILQAFKAHLTAESAAAAPDSAIKNKNDS